MNFEFAYLLTYFYVYWVKSLSFDLGNTCTLSTEVSVLSFSILVSWIVQGNLSIFYKLPETVAVLWLAVSLARCIFMGSYNWDFVDQYFRTLRTSLRADFHIVIVRLIIFSTPCVCMRFESLDHDFSVNDMVRCFFCLRSVWRLKRVL